MCALGRVTGCKSSWGNPEKAIVIPRGNFYQQTGGNWIFKLNADRTKAVKVPITISRQNPRQYEITEGLQPEIGLLPQDMITLAMRKN